eukprot:6827497-Alexandrium_andersonii.AAC.1
MTSGLQLARMSPKDRACCESGWRGGITSRILVVLSGERLERCVSRSPSSLLQGIPQGLNPQHAPSGHFKGT